MSAKPRFAIRESYEDESLAMVSDVHDFFTGTHDSRPGVITSDSELDEWTFTVSGLSPVLPEGPLGSIDIHLLDADGRSMGKYSAWGVELARVGEDLHRISGVTAILADRDAEPVWELWRRGGPARKGLWAEVPAGRRRGWLEVVALNAFATGRAIRAAVPVSEIVLDGTDVVDLASFYLAIGEAVNGPGGYFGWNLDALSDCLGGRWGSIPAPKIVWRDFAVARSALAYPRGGHESTLDAVLRVIRDAGAELVFG